MKAITGLWNKPLEVTRNNFIYKSLSCWAANIAVGCTHACRFCYVPDVSTIRMGTNLKTRGVDDPDAQWGEYVFLRPWDEKLFTRSVIAADKMPASALNADGNRAVMFCTTTDPYMVIKNDDAAKQRELNEHRERMVSGALRVIYESSTINVRILTRSPLAKKDFGIMLDLAKQRRIVLGASIPTLNEKLSRVYEPHAPSPQQRMKMLHEAKDAGIPVYVAVAPTYPECDYDDLVETLKAVKKLDPVTIFHEPINVRAENVARIDAHAKTLGMEMKTDVFATATLWADYAGRQLNDMYEASKATGTKERLHLWPDKSLLRHHPHDKAWFERWWHRISEWPK